MKRILSLLLAVSLCGFAQSSDAAIDRVFQAFTEDWLRLNPSVATSSKYFPKEEQLRLDALLAEETPQQTQRQLDLLRRYQAELSKVDLSKVSRSRRLAARVLQHAFDETLRAEPLIEYRYVFNKSSFAPHSKLVFC